MKNTALAIPLISVPDPAMLPGRCRGDNARQVFVVYQAADQEDPERCAFLEKVLAAVQLDMYRDATLLRLDPGESFSWGLLRGRCPATTFISFGVEPARMGLRFALSPYQPVRQAATTYLLADDIGVIHEERQKGGKERAGLLWRTLKILFP